MGKWLRQPKTTQERREWLTALEMAREYPQLRVRRARSKTNLPTHWDDIGRPQGQSNWKLYRQHQYREKPIRRETPGRPLYCYRYSERELCLNPHRHYIWSLWEWQGNGEFGTEIRISHRRRFPRFR